MLRHYIVRRILGMCDLIFITIYNIFNFGFILIGLFCTKWLSLISLLCAS